MKKVLLEISQNSQESTRTRASLVKKRLRRRCFPVNFAKFIRTPILKNICKQLLLKQEIIFVRVFQKSRKEVFSVLKSQKRPIKKVIPKNLALFTGEHWCWISFRPASNFTGKRSSTGVCFPVNYAKFFRKTCLQNTSDWLI